MSQHIGTCVIVLNSAKTHVLLGRRKNNYKAGSFGLPGGRIEIGEKVDASAEREILEETGLRATCLRYIGVVKEFQETYDFVHFAFVCEEFEGEPKVMEPEKCESWEWYELSKLPEGVLPGHRAAIEIYQHPEASLIDL